MNPSSTRGPWWRDAVIYQVYVRSFADSDGDGVGDLPGVRERLPYLSRLGVDALWITPFYASPMADGGYDVADYRAVDPLFGTLDDAQALIEDAHRLGLRVLVDIVPNHSSDQHAWFREALAAGPTSPMRERYHFLPGRGAEGELPPNDWESVFGGPAWSRTTNPDGTAGDWYLHLFAPQQPDLNWRHPTVHEEFRQVLRFWLDLDVDGFRIDVAHGLVKAEGLPDIGHRQQLQLLGNEPLPFFDQDGVHEIYREWRTVLDEYPGERIFVAEAWTPNAERTARYLRPDELHQAFNFHFLTAPYDAAALRTVIDAELQAMRPVDAPPTWVLSNHDVQRHVTRYGGGEVGLRRGRAVTQLILALPGSVYLYQGEELGLEEVLDLPAAARQDPQGERDPEGESGRDGCRVPLPWSGQYPPYGFSPQNPDTGTGPATWLPQPTTQWAGLSVAAQEDDADSTLWFYRRVLAVRREHPALGADAGLDWLPAPDGVLMFRRHRADAPSVVCVANLGNRPVRLPQPERTLLSSEPLRMLEDSVEVPADTTAWWVG